MPKPILAKHDDDVSVASDYLFEIGHDDIIFEGTLYKFKPGLSSNFVSRFVQVSQRAFRYFKDRKAAQAGRPLVSFRKHILKDAVWYQINKQSYLKPGAKVSQSLLEHQLFENVFEIRLREDYEDHSYFRDMERRLNDSPTKSLQSHISPRKNKIKRSFRSYHHSAEKAAKETVVNNGHAMAIRDSVRGTTFNKYIHAQGNSKLTFRNLRQRVWAARFQWPHVADLAQPRN